MKYDPKFQYNQHLSREAVHKFIRKPRKLIDTTWLRFNCVHKVVRVEEDHITLVIPDLTIVTLFLAELLGPQSFFKPCTKPLPKIGWVIKRTDRNHYFLVTAYGNDSLQGIRVYPENCLVIEVALSISDFLREAWEPVKESRRYAKAFRAVNAASIFNVDLRETEAALWTTLFPDHPWADPNRADEETPPEKNDGLKAEAVEQSESRDPKTVAEHLREDPFSS